MKTKRLLFFVLIALFASVMVNAAVPVRKGLWKFDDAADMLKATIGAALDTTGFEHFSAAGPYDGNLSIADPRWKSLIMAHGLGGNGGGTRLNEYTMQWDVMIPDLTNWHALIQTGLSNEGDGELFIKNTSGLLGLSALKWSTNTIAPNTWYRIVQTVKCGSFARVYVDGVLWIEGNVPAIDSRFSLNTEPRVFGDDDGEDDLIYCSELGLWDVALTDAEVAELGNATTLSFPAKKGQWLFDDAADMMKATIGNPLVPTTIGANTSVAGPAAGNLAISDPKGPALVMDHAIAANGGGTLVNEYSLQIDFSVPGPIPSYVTFIQNGPLNDGDGDLFIKGSTKQIGLGVLGWSTSTVVSDKWYRMVISAKCGEFYRVYIDGVLFLEKLGITVDSRHALKALPNVFGDDDGDDGLINCAELAVWDVALTAAQAAELGAVTVDASGVKSVNMTKTADLGRNYPNPFSGVTTFPYQVQQNGNVSFRILDLSGKEVQTINEGTKSVGDYKLEISSANLNNGVYYVQMISNKTTSTQKMVVIK